ncbi:MAG: hypothetical protein ACOCUL_02345 [Bacteroidota bacterium]
MDLSDIIARDIIDMTPYDSKLNIEVLNITGLKLLGRFYLDWNLNKVKKMIYSQGEETSYWNKAEQFRVFEGKF